MTDSSVSQSADLTKITNFSNEPQIMNKCFLSHGTPQYRYFTLLSLLNSIKKDF